MPIIRNLNDLHEKAPITYLASAEVAGTTIIRSKNTTGLTTGWAFQIGKTGEDRTEVVLGTVTNVGTLTVAALDFDHPADTPIYGIKYNQVVFEKSVAGTAGTATPIASGTIEYQADSTHTIFDDTSGTTTDAYRTYFRNSALTLNTTESDWITPTGHVFYSLAKMRNRVREKLWDSNFVQDGEIDNWINEWKEEMTNSLVAVNEDYAIGTVGVTFGTSGLGTITTADFKQPRKIEVTYNGSDYYLSTKQDINVFQPTQTYNTTHPYHNWEGDTIIHVKPAESGGTAKIYFYRTGTPMVNDTDELALPMRGYTRSFVDYGLGMAYQKDGKTKDADRKFSDAYGQKDMFVRQLTPRDKSSQTMVHLEEVISGDDWI